MIRSLTTKGVIAGFVLYPLVVHYSITHHEPVLASLYLTSLLSVVTILKTARQQLQQALLFGLLALLTGIAGLSGHAVLVIYLLPLLILGILLFVFANSLTEGNTPYITRLAQLIREQPLAPAVCRYTKWVTIAWTILFLILLLELLLLLFFAPLRVWSYATNFFNYALITLFFVVEYIVRRVHLREVEHIGFLPFLKKLIQINRKT